MMSVIRPRWRKPAWTVLAGAMFAAAWAIRGGRNWWLFVTLVALATAVRAFTFYAWGGEDDDLGALAGSRGDERQKQISMRSWALAGRLTMIAAFLGLTAAVAARATWWWPFVVLLAVAVYSYLLGLSDYGAAKEGPAEDADAEDEARSPMKGS
jgi:hypothetical protein